MVGFSRSSNSSRSRRRRLVHGANRNDSNCSRPPARHNLFLQRSPSFSATACSWFIIRVRACTMRWRCHSSWRRSRFSQLGTQIGGSRPSATSPEYAVHLVDPFFVCGRRLRRISDASPTRSSNFSSASSRSNQRACPLASIPTHTPPLTFGR